MPIGWLTDAHKSQLKTGFPPRDRLYIDFRQVDYPSVAGTPTYTAADFLDDLTDCQLALGFDEGSGATSTDKSANANTLNLNGTYTWVAGRRGTAINLGGAVTDYGVTASNVPALGATWSVFACITPTGVSGTQTIASNARPILRLSNDDVQIVWNNSAIATQTLTAADVATAGTEMCVLATHTGNTTCLYIDGILRAIETAQDSAAVAAGLWRVGLHTDSLGAFGGVIDDVRVYDIALSSAQAWMLAMRHFPGSHALTGGNSAYLCPLQTKFVFDVRCSAQFQYDTGSNQYLWGWYVDATHWIAGFYAQSLDVISVAYQWGGTQRLLVTAAFTATTLPTLARVVASIDLSTAGVTTGSILRCYDKDGTVVGSDTAWSGVIDDLAGGQAPILGLRIRDIVAGTAGAWDIYSVRLFQGRTATAAEMDANFADEKDEEIYWSFDGHAVGHTRCNVTSYTRSIHTHRAIGDLDTGSLIANTMSADLFSIDGEFADDQYAAFSPTDAQYNGTSAQAYMRQRCRVELETWYGDYNDRVFIGRVQDGFQRSTSPESVSMVNISCADQVADVAMRRLRRGRFYEAYNLASDTESDSLIHTIVRLGTQREVYNYASNSSFENATIANSWTASGGTLTREADPLLGTYCGQLANASGSEQTVTQIITYTGTKKLNVGETYTWAVWLKSAGAATADIRLEERDAGGTNGTSTTTYSLAGGEGWVPYEVTRTMTDSTSDRLAIVVEVANGETIKMDCAMLTQSSRAYSWFVLNNNDGSSGTESADDADSATYDTHGFMVDPVSIEHPWVRLAAEESPWASVKALNDAVLGYQCGFDEAGTFVFRGVLSDSYEDLPYSETITQALSIASALVGQRANKIIVRGVYIVIATEERMVWMASASGAFPLAEDGRLAYAVANGATWPPPAIYGDFVCRYDVETPLEIGVIPGTYVGILLTGTPRGQKSGNVGYGAPRGYPGSEIIGLKTPRLAQTLNVGSGILTVTTLDAITYGDGTQLLLTNGTGEEKTIRDIGLIGLPVYRASGRSGFVHDAYTDWERLEREGEVLAEISNDYIVTAAQVNKIADWHRKFHFDSQKHTYTLEESGGWYWAVPGITYKLQHGGAGEPEYINATARLVDVSTERSADTIGQTRLVFQEIQQGWVFNSTSVARFLAGQDYSRMGENRDWFVASNSHVGHADYFCDGTADQVQINSALLSLSQLGGGNAHLTDGLFVLSDSIQMQNNTRLILSSGTVIEKNCDDFAIRIVGAADARLVNVSIEGEGTVTRNAADTNLNSLIRCQYADEVMIDGVVCTDSGVHCISVTQTSGITVQDCRLSNAEGACILFFDESSTGQILNNYCTGTKGTGTTGSAFYGMIMIYSGAIRVEGNIIHDVSALGGNVCGIFLSNTADATLVTGNTIRDVIGDKVTGIEVVSAITDASDCLISHNRIEGLRGGLGGSTVVCAVYNEGVNTLVSNNQCLDNGGLILYGDCEHATNWPRIKLQTGYSTSGGTPTRVSTPTPPYGTYCLNLNKDGAPEAQYIFHDHAVTTTTDMGGLVPGVSYKLDIYMRCPAAVAVANYIVRFGYYDAAAWTDSDLTCSAQDTWESKTTTVAIPATATGMRLYALIAAAEATGDDVQFDHVLLTPLGVNNEHTQNFYDDGTATQVVGNSWQNPFEG